MSAETIESASSAWRCRPRAEALHVSLITAEARVKRSGVARCKVEVFDAHT